MVMGKRLEFIWLHRSRYIYCRMYCFHNSFFNLSVYMLNYGTYFWKNFHYDRPDTLHFDASSVNHMLVVFSFSICPALTRSIVCHLVWTAEECGPPVSCSDVQNGHFLLNIVDTLVLTGWIETFCSYENLA
jgi:hypothetical protein